MGIEWKRVLGNFGMWRSLFCVMICNVLLFAFINMGGEWSYARAEAESRLRLLAELESGVMSEEEFQDRLNTYECLSQLYYYQYEKQSDPEFYELIYQEEELALREEHPELALEFDAGQYESERVQIEYSALTAIAAEMEYCAQYGEKLAEVRARAETLQRLSVFQNASGGADRNITKTLRDYERMEGKTVVIGNDKPVVIFLSYGLIPIFGLIFALIFVKKLTEENEWKLRPLIFASSHGRFALTVWRGGILVIGSIISAVCLYGSTLLTAIYFFGTFRTDRLLQSIESFFDVTYPVTIGEMLFLYILLGCAVQIVIMFSVWFFAALFEQYRMVLLSVIALYGISAAAYYLIPLQSALVWLKYANLYAFVDFHSLFFSYRNLSLFGVLIEKTLYCIFVGGILLAALLIGTCSFGSRKYPIRTHSRVYQYIQRVMEGASQIYHRLTARLNIWGMECYKLLKLQHGWLIIVLLGFFLVQSYPVKQVTYVGAERLMNTFYSEWSGALTPELEQYILDFSDKLESVEQEYIDGNAAYQNGELSLAEYETLLQKYNAYAVQREALVRIQEAVGYVQTLEAQGYAAKLVNPLGYQYLLEDFGEDDKVILLITVLALILLVSGTYAYERRHGVSELLHVTKKGRIMLGGQKLLTVCFFAVIAYALYIGCRVWQAANSYGLQGLNYPAKSLMLFEKCPDSWTILTVLLLTGLMQIVLFVAIAAFTALLSALFRNEVAVSVIGAAVCIVPGALDMAGLADMKKLPIWKVTDMLCEAVWQGKHTGVVIALLLAAGMCGVGSILLWSGCKKR